MNMGAVLDQNREVLYTEIVRIVMELRYSREVP